MHAKTLHFVIKSEFRRKSVSLHCICTLCRKHSLALVLFFSGLQTLNLQTNCALHQKYRSFYWYRVLKSAAIYSFFDYVKIIANSEEIRWFRSIRTTFPWFSVNSIKEFWARLFASRQEEEKNTNKSLDTHKEPRRVWSTFNWIWRHKEAKRERFEFYLPLFKCLKFFKYGILIKFSWNYVKFNANTRTKRNCKRNEICAEFTKKFQTECSSIMLMPFGWISCVQIQKPKNH